VGIRPFPVQLTAFVISGMITGLAGALYADLNRFVSARRCCPGTMSGEIMVFVILGGVARLFGPVAGAALFILLEHLLGGVSGLLAGGSWACCCWPSSCSPRRLSACGAGEAAAWLTRSSRSVASKSFGALKATDDVSLDLRPGEIHALIGPNGAGKSTLIKQIVGEIRQDAGTIRFEGQAIDGSAAAERARLGLARSFQVSSLAPEFSVLQNVMLAVQGASGESFRFFRPALRDPALTEPARSTSRTRGLGARGRSPAADLSHGERRRLEIAMALALGRAPSCWTSRWPGWGRRGRRLTALLSDLRAGADPAGGARHGRRLRAGRPHFGAGLRPHHRHRHRGRDPRQP
jgi:branched-chain amino acid transport system ATP-binding protein